jgi:hypothetical protein
MRWCSSQHRVTSAGAPKPAAAKPEGAQAQHVLQCRPASPHLCSHPRAIKGDGQLAKNPSAPTTSRASAVPKARIPACVGLEHEHAAREVVGAKTKTPPTSSLWESTGIRDLLRS